MTPAYLDLLATDGAALGAVAAGTAPVPTCGDWTQRDLVGHVGRLHRGIAHLVGERRTQQPEEWAQGWFGDVPDGDLTGWYADGLAALLDVLAATDPAEPVWNWSPAQAHVASFWRRRMAQETAVHRWDGEAATGEPASLDPALAADGVDEVLRVFLPRLQARRPVPLLSGTLALETTDTGHRWGVLLEPSSVEVRTGNVVRADGADARATGPASDVVLALWGRVPFARLDVHDRTGLLARWRAGVRF